MSIEKLESSLKRNKFIERRYKQGSKNKIKVQAIIILLEEEIRSRVDDDLDIDSLLAP